MTFIGKAQALRAAFRVPDNVPLPQAPQPTAIPHMGRGGSIFRLDLPAHTVRARRPCAQEERPPA